MPRRHLVSLDGLSPPRGSRARAAAALALCLAWVASDAAPGCLCQPPGVAQACAEDADCPRGFACDPAGHYCWYRGATDDARAVDRDGGARDGDSLDRAYPDTGHADLPAAEGSAPGDADLADQAAVEDGARLDAGLADQAAAEDASFCGVEDGGLLATAWTGLAGDGRWSTPANWSCGASPTRDHVAIFDRRCQGFGGCAATIDLAAEVAGLRLEDSYSGTLTQGTGHTLRVGAAGWVQRGGAFEGGDSDVEVDAEVWLEGGTLRSTRATFSVGRFSPSHNPDGLRISAGSFEHNNGALRFDGAKDANALWTTVATIDTAQPLVLHDLIIDVADPNSLQDNDGACVTLTGAGAIEVQGQLRLRDGKLRGNTLVLKGDLMVECPDPGRGVCAEGSLSRVALRGEGTQRYGGTYPGVAPFVVLDTDHRVEPAEDLVDYAFCAVKVAAGTFVSPPGVWRFHCDREYGQPAAAGDEGLVVAGGALVNQSSALVVEIEDGTDMHDVAGFTFDVGELSIPSLSIRIDDYNLRSGYNEIYARLVEGTRLQVAGDFVLSDGRLEGGQIEIGGDLSLGCEGNWHCAGGGSTRLVLDGDAQQLSQGWAGTGGGGFRAAVPGDVLTLQPAGQAAVVTLLGPLVLDAPGQDLALLTGSLDAAGYPIAIDDTLLLEAGATVLLRGASLTYGHLDDRGGLIEP